MTSGCRFRHGLILGGMTYASNGIMRMLFKRQMPARLPLIRKETSFLGRLPFLPVLLSAALLFLVFSWANPTLTRARGLNCMKRKLISLELSVAQAKRVVPKAKFTFKNIINSLQIRFLMVRRNTIENAPWDKHKTLPFAPSQ